MSKKNTKRPRLVVQDSSIEELKITPRGRRTVGKKTISELLTCTTSAEPDINEENILQFPVVQQQQDLNPDPVNVPQADAPTAHERRKENSVQKWASLRHKFIDAFVVEQSVSRLEDCPLCDAPYDSNNFEVKCLQCRTRMCTTCVHNQHSAKPFHNIQIWTGDMFEPYQYIRRVEQSPHKCQSHKMNTEMEVIDESAWKYC
ncbi:uncharacterized protein [Amphiura filiformis]|uniref:uncharacterized protein n=1 Tax=Amphiura filiformis TaxID=82378 RepID=UPI003B21ED49